jgi:hypothetical protein
LLSRHGIIAITWNLSSVAHDKKPRPRTISDFGDACLAETWKFLFKALLWI